jgi:hypothetical protein
MKQKDERSVQTTGAFKIQMALKVVVMLDVSTVISSCMVRSYQIASAEHFLTRMKY